MARAHNGACRARIHTGPTFSCFEQADVAVTRLMGLGLSIRTSLLDGLVSSSGATTIMAMLE